MAHDLNDTRDRAAGRPAIVVGSGPNGLVAAITLARAGWDVTVYEAAAAAGGGLRSEELTLPGFVHDVCSAVHPLALASPALRGLESASPSLADHGLAWLQPELPLAHPLDGGEAALLHRSVDLTAAGLAVDADAYRRLFSPLVEAGLELTDGVLAPLTIPPPHPIHLARFGVHGIRSVEGLARRFRTAAGRALLAGLGGHSILALDAPVTAGYALMLGQLAHVVGWPIARGGSGQIATALVAMLESLGGRVITGHRVGTLRELPHADAVLLDVTPRQALAIAGDVFPQRYRRSLERYRYGAGVFKLDWALDSPIPWADPRVADAATVHVGGTLEEIALAEKDVQRGRHAERPFVLLTQPSLVDPSRAPTGAHTAWAYCHVPNGSTVDMTERIEAQIERFAPGFGDRIAARHAMTTVDVEAHDENYVGGDINGGVADLWQLVRRPIIGLHPWRTPVRGIYLCSSATPPGGGVHGMCGRHAALTALRDLS